MDVVFNSNINLKDKTEKNNDLMKAKSAKSDGKKNIIHPNSKIDKANVVI